MPKANDYIGIIVFSLLILLVIYLAFTLKTRQNEIVKRIRLTGGTYLTNDQYLDFAKLNAEDEYENLTLAILKDRLEKHPYIKKADVMMEKDGNVDIKIHEKNIDAFLNCGTKQYLISEEFEALPLLSFTKKINCPVISNPVDAAEIKNYRYLLKSKELKTAFKLIETTRLLGQDLLESISEIDLRNGKDIVVYLSGVNYPVVLGRRNEIRKMIYFSKFWNKLKGNEINEVVDYIDLRFDNHLYLGFTGGFEEEDGA
jgi:cell division protein FtsQ